MVKNIEVKSTFSRWAEWVAYAACAWALLFAALSFFWAAGGRTGLHPLEQQPMVNTTMWVIFNLVAGILKALGGLFALLLVRYRKRGALRRLLFILAWAAGVGMILYGGLGLISDVLHVSGIMNDPSTWKWFFWYLVLWDPWWVLGGVLYVAVAWLVRRRDAAERLENRGN